MPSDLDLFAGVIADAGMAGAAQLPGIDACRPRFIRQGIEDARSIEQLRALSANIRGMAEIAVRVDADIRSIVRIISGMNDAIVLRLIALLASSEGIRLPKGAAYLVLGSEGRGEQTLRTDQDNAIVYDDELPAEALRQVDRFAARMVDALEEIGVPRCPGNIMASSPHWRHGLREWKQLVNSWVTAPTPEHVLCFGMLQDLRPLHGDLDLGTRLRDHIVAAVWRQPNFFSNMAHHAVRFPSPFTLFRRIRVEEKGEYKGKTDLKKAGIFAITKGVSLLVLEAGLVGGSTWENLEQLRARKVIGARDAAGIEQAFSHLIKLRLQRQILELSADRQATNHVDPRALTEEERDRLRQALRGVVAFISLFRDHYNLDFKTI